MENKKTVNILNTDELVDDEDRLVVIDGKNYPISTPSVGVFLKMTMLNTAFYAIEKPTIPEQVEFLTNSIILNLGGNLDKETLMNKCSVLKLNVISNFIRDGSLPEELEAASKGSEKKQPMAVEA